MGIPFPDIDIVAFSIGSFNIRWYALAYLTGFLGGWRYMIYLAGLYKKDSRPDKEDVDVILPWLVIGVILGGRIGYVLFYNFDYYMANPLSIAAVWEGGMSFHGGLMGVVTMIVIYGYRSKTDILRMGDMASCVTPIGLFFGRLANFVNGELFGRVTNVPWAFNFPYGGDLPRHPSQLYEAFLEGIVLFILLGLMMHREKIRNKSGVVFGTLLTGYACARFLIEFVREPDPHLGLYLDFFSRGQILSIPMMIAGIIIIRYALRKNAKKE